MRLLATLVLTLTAVCIAKKKTFHNYKVYRLTPNDAESFKALKSLGDEPLSELDFWSPPVAIGVPVDVMVPPHQQERIRFLLESTKMKGEVFIKNVQDLIDRENLKRSILREGEINWTEYHPLEHIYAWLENLCDTYPDILTLINAGFSYEGRELLGVRLSFNPNNANRSVFIESNIHAREWITSAVSTYILNEFLTSNDTAIRAVAESHDWYFFPVFNPDGLAYTHSTNRLWRKTRVPHSVFCVGTDPNRNWGYHWMDGGSSSNPCSETYAGPSAFSEPCTRVMSEFIDTIADQLLGYISFHSYSQLLLLSYGHTTDHLDNYDELYPIGLKAMEVLAQRYQTSYVTGNIGEAIYIASGGSMDWVKGTYGTPVTYTYELRDTGRYGFVLPAEQIIPTALETLDSILSIFEQWKSIHPEDYQ